MKKLIFLPLLFLVVFIKAQDETGLLAFNENRSNKNADTTKTIRFANSDNPDFTFIVNPNIEEKTLYIETNFTGKYKIRFLDYYGESKKVYSDNVSDTKIDVRELGRGIFVMNIIDEKSRRLLTSQILNLKRWGF